MCMQMCRSPIITGLSFLMHHAPESLAGRSGQTGIPLRNIADPVTSAQEEGEPKPKNKEATHMFWI